MSNLSALRRQAAERHRQLRWRCAESGVPLLPASEILEAAEAETDVVSLALAPDDALLAGAHAVLDRATPCIWYAESDDILSSWQNFARAHEFGHYWLHPDLETDVCAVNEGPAGIGSEFSHPEGIQTEVGYSPVERREKEADLFASELLLPGAYVRQAFQNHGWTASRIASYVGVPESCALTQMATGLLLPTTEGGEDRLSEAEPDRPMVVDPLLALDESQRAAAAIDAGPVLVDAGPGTGKTRTLVARLAYLLQTLATPPENILALTFSNAAAEEMRVRLRQTVGALADRVWIGTFHAFGLELLRKEGYRIGLPQTPTLLETADAVALLEQNLDRLRLREFEFLSLPILPFPDILQCISRAKDDLKTPADYLAMAERQSTDAGSDESLVRAARKSSEVAGIYAVYQQLLAERGMVDFGDLLMRPVELLDACPDVRLRWSEKFRHILADEYQDINRASAQLLRRLAGDGRGLWAVGDLRQAIYRFRGASPANVVDFNLDFPGGRRLQLRHNYRSRPDIVTLFGKFAGRMDASAEVDIGWQPQRRSAGGPAITLAVAANEEAQAAGLANAIAQRQAAGIALREQAILCHTNRQVSELAARLEEHGIATQHLGPLFEREEIKDLLALLSLASEPDGAALARIARFPIYSIPDADVFRLLRAAREENRPFPGALSLATTLPDLSDSGRAGLQRLHYDLRNIAYHGDAWRLLARYLFETSDYLRPILADAGLAATKKRLGIYQLLVTAQGLARRFAEEPEHSRSGFLAYLRLLLACGQERSIRPPAEASEIDGVRIMTVHQSKGLEFPVVYLPNLIEGQFPPRRGSRMAAPPPELLRAAEDDAEADEGASEECLFFVAMSRARDELVLCRPRTWQSKAAAPCRLLAEIEPLLAGSSTESAFWPADIHTPPVVASAATPQGPQSPPQTWSVSALEQYQRCPRQFYYQRVARLPRREAESAYLAFHTSVSETLEWLQGRRNDGHEPDASAVNERFGEVWDAQGEVTNTGLGRVLRRRAVEMLRGAQETVTTAHRPQTKQILTADLEHGKVELTCDQMDELPDGTLRLVDYTTQRPRDNDHTAPRLALLRHAAQQQHGERPVRVIISNLHSGEEKEVPASKRWEPARVEKYNAAMKSIRESVFDADPEPRKCALCPYFLVCPA
jgi:superfamily I DNA/RNA helicase/Zn-dependent peptidase ImmA (M78 family)/CRISPR/Cas system-associated exonuclease Cas4 (RecB family)